MATVNKASLRTEFDALKARFESLCAEGKMSPESRAHVDALLMLFELLMAVFMEKHTPKSPANSGLPPSQSPNDATARTRPGAKGKGPSYNEARCANTRTREHVRVLGVDSCARCGEDLTDTACTGHQRRTLVDIVFEKVVRHADAEIKHCPRCHTEAPGALPRRDARPAPVRPRHQGLRRAPAHRADALAQTRRPIDARPHRPAPVRGDAPRLHRPTPSRARRVGAPSHRAPPRTTGDARRRDLVARGPKESLDSRLDATRQGWSRRIGVCDDFMKPCLSSSGCETRPAKGEPARPVASLAPETVTDSAMRRYANEWAVSHVATKGICFPGCPGC